MWRLVYAALFAYLAPNAISAKSCREVENIYDRIVNERVAAPLIGVVGDDGRICNGRSPCCTTDMEYQLSLLSQSELETIRSNSIATIPSAFIQNRRRFNDYMTNLMDKAQGDFNHMFMRTYGLLFRRSKHIYSSLFTNIREYYRGEDVDLGDKLEEFFVDLYKYLWKAFNPQYDFSETYMQCVGDLVETIEPFGDSKNKVTRGLKKAMLLSRNYRQGFNTGADVLETIMQNAMMSNCRKSSMEMMYCAQCNGKNSAKPCNNYCTTVVASCLVGYSELNVAWNRFVGSLVQMSESISFHNYPSAESILGVMDIYISDSIMNAQENTNLISTVFDTCGTPGRKRRRSKRSAWSKRSFDQSPRKTRDHDEIADMVKDIVPQLEAVKDIWINLPRSMCDVISTANKPTKAAKPCWNGENVGSDIEETSNTMAESVCGNMDDDNAKVVCRAKEKLDAMARQLTEGQYVYIEGDYDEDDMGESGSGQ